MRILFLWEYGLFEGKSFHNPKASDDCYFNAGTLFGYLFGNDPIKEYLGNIGEIPFYPPDAICFKVCHIRGLQPVNMLFNGNNLFKTQGLNLFKDNLNLVDDRCNVSQKLLF